MLAWLRGSKVWNWLKSQRNFKAPGQQFTSIKTTKTISMNEFAWCQRINPTPDSGSFHYQKSFIHSCAPPHIPSKLLSIGNIRRTHSRASCVIKRECIRKGEGERAKKIEAGAAPTTSCDDTKALNFHRHKRASEVRWTSPKKWKKNARSLKAVYTHMKAAIGTFKFFVSSSHPKRMVVVADDEVFVPPLCYRSDVM